MDEITIIEFRHEDTEWVRTQSISIEEARSVEKKLHEAGFRARIIRVKVVYNFIT